MATTDNKEITMLAELIESSTSGKKVDLTVKPRRDVVKMKREDRDIDSVILSMEYSGTIDGKPFSLEKNYSFAEDLPQYALECLLLANNRLQMDYDRLKEAGIHVKEAFFTFQNSFMGLPGDASVKSPALRLQDFVHLSNTGVPVSVEITLKSPSLLLKAKGIEKEGFSYMASFEFTTGKDKTSIEKMYLAGYYDDTKRGKEEIKDIANRRLERDCERLRRSGIEVEKLAF